MSLNIVVICGSSRRERKSLAPARFVAGKAAAAGHAATLVDFMELLLPWMDLPVTPSSLKKQYPDANVQKWSAIADAADAFIIVSPEYNHGYPAVLKNALDWLYYEFRHKPVGLVGVSDGLVGGARVIEQLRLLAGNFSMFDIRETVMVKKAQDVFDVDGKLLDDSYEKQFDGLLATLSKVAEVMKRLRA
jgi:NAD(P)H-dependent FMN reductase